MLPDKPLVYVSVLQCVMVIKFQHLSSSSSQSGVCIYQRIKLIQMWTDLTAERSVCRAVRQKPRIRLWEIESVKWSVLLCNELGHTECWVDQVRLCSNLSTITKGNRLKKKCVKLWNKRRALKWQQTVSFEIHSGIKALKKLPVPRCVLNFYSILIGNETSHLVSEVINKHKMLPVFTEWVSLFI